MLTQLGEKTQLPASPDEARLETVPFAGDGQMTVRLTCPEFTSLCPVTGQPDFATIVVDYIPGDRLVESKSIKLYFGSFRNHPSFHEAVTQRIATDLMEVLSPRWMRVVALFNPRGGIPIDCFWQWDNDEDPVYIPPLNMADIYRAR